LNVEYTCIGEYGETLREKLAVEQKRTLQFIDLFDKIGLPKVLWTHGDVSAIRTAFGLQIPIVYANDTPHAVHVAKLVCPLVDWLVAPVSFGKSWSKFGIPKAKIVLYDGIEEVAWLHRKVEFERPPFLEEAVKKNRVVLFRNAEYKASYCKNVKVDTFQLVKEISKNATVVYLPRYAEEKEKLEDLSNVVIPPKTALAFQLIPYVDAVVGSGGTICREAALMGVPTINFHFWDAAAKYLHKKGFPIKYVATTSKIIKAAQKILKNTEKHRMNTRQMLEKLESPVPITVDYIERCQGKRR
jgi:predicted glycosyltransferase